MKLISIQIGMPKFLGSAEANDPMDKAWESGIFKNPVTGPILVHDKGLIGDGQADLKNHGGLDKAINAYPQEHFSYWKKHLGITCEPGAFGENFTTNGLIEKDVFIGDIFHIGKLTVQITQPRQPCWKLVRKWKEKSLAALVQQTGYTGWYFRVLQAGEVEAPGELKLIDRPHPEWSISRANDIMYNQTKDWDTSHQLGSCPALSENWKNTLLMRAEKRQNKSDQPRLKGESDH